MTLCPGCVENQLKFNENSVRKGIIKIADCNMFKRNAVILLGTCQWQKSLLGSSLKK